MANRLLRLTVHDPVVIKALDSLRHSRKQSAFVVEALRHFLGTEGGREQLKIFLDVKAPKVSGGAEFKDGRKISTEGESPKTTVARGAKVNLDDIFDG